jgi:hypothetical protein
LILSPVAEDFAMHALWSLVSLTALCGASPAEPAPAKVQESVKRGLVFLEKEGLAWKEGRNCASCHHVPQMLWAMNEAKNHGYAVNDKALAEVTAWVLSADDKAKVMPKPAKAGEKFPADTLPQGAQLNALGVEAARTVDGPTREGLKRLLATLPPQQAAAGWWGLPSGGRPPIVESNEVLTGLTLLALTAPAAGPEDAQTKTSREKAVKWLTATPPGDGHQAAVVRLLLRQRQGQAKDLPALVKDLTRRQNADGGWSQAKDMGSDAYATGQTLYALALAGVPAADPAVAKGQAFLVKSQQADGGWPMTSRPSKPGDTGSKNLKPIRFAGSAWGTMGLAVSAPMTPPAAAAAAPPKPAGTPVK